MFFIQISGDHALIDLAKIHGFEPKQITVRTKSRDSVSADSVPTQIPTHFGKGRGRGKVSFYFFIIYCIFVHFL